MRNLIFSYMAAMLLGTSAFAAAVSSVSCESQMQFGFFSGNEIGTFTYTASPLSVFVLVSGKGEVVIDDSTHVCTVAVAASEMPLFSYWRQRFSG